MKCNKTVRSLNIRIFSDCAPPILHKDLLDNDMCTLTGGSITLLTGRTDGKKFQISLLVKNVQFTEVLLRAQLIKRFRQHNILTKIERFRTKNYLITLRPKLRVNCSF